MSFTSLVLTQFSLTQTTSNFKRRICMRTCFPVKNETLFKEKRQKILKHLSPSIFCEATATIIQALINSHDIEIQILKFISLSCVFSHQRVLVNCFVSSLACWVVKQKFALESNYWKILPPSSQERPFIALDIRSRTKHSFAIWGGGRPALGAIVYSWGSSGKKERSFLDVWIEPFYTEALVSDIFVTAEFGYELALAST